MSKTKTDEQLERYISLSNHQYMTAVEPTDERPDVEVSFIPPHEYEYERNDENPKYNIQFTSQITLVHNQWNMKNLGFHFLVWTQRILLAFLLLLLIPSLTLVKEAKGAVTRALNNQQKRVERAKGTVELPLEIAVRGVLCFFNTTAGLFCRAN
mmetsp:Transcript_34772/g.68651  ORF Transcript_34772/g.68651 Transcript_34772/m.68651 type:complete len:154 (+) Transcript_34772:58-519(+)